MSFEKTEIKPGDELQMLTSMLSKTPVRAKPEVLVLFAPKDVTVVNLIVGTHVAMLRERDKALVEHNGREFVVEFATHNHGILCNGLPMLLRLKAGEHGGEVRAHILGRRDVPL